MSAARCAVASGVSLFMSLAGLGLGAATARAEGPGCVEVVVPEPVEERATFLAMVEREAQDLIDPNGAPCAQIALVGQSVETLSVRVSWQGLARDALLGLSDQPRAQHARIAALVAEGLLRQLIDERDAAAERERERRAKTATSAALTAPPAPRSRTAEGGTEPRRADARRAAWSFAASLGSALVFESTRAVSQLELGAQLRPQGWFARLGVSVVAALAGARSRAGRIVWLGGPGLRASADFLLADFEHTSLWLGPGVSYAQLALGKYVSATSDRPRSWHAVVSTDARLGADFSLRAGRRIGLALEFAYALRHLRVREQARLLLAYAGPMLGLRVSASF